MAKHRESHSLEGPFSEADPVAELVLFFRANGYRVQEPESESKPREQDAVSPARSAKCAVLERGKPGAGWFSSDLTELHTRLELRREDERVCLEYLVDVSGQRLTDEERGFWTREARAAEAYLRGEGDLINIREEERARAAKVRRDMVTMGLWLGAVIGAFVFLAALIILK